MTEQSNSSNGSPIAIPSFYLSRLEAISSKLDISQKDAIQALFTWTEMGLSIADSLSIAEPTPQEIYESFEQLKNGQKASSSINNNHSDSELIFNENSVNQLFTSFRILSEAISRQQQNKSQVGAKVGVVKPKKTNKMSARGIEPERIVNKGIDKIIEFNNAKDTAPEDKWYINPTCVRKLTGKGEGVIKRVIERDRKDELDAHHSLHELNNRSNVRGMDYPSIDTIISFSN